jgi:hypothetical protein
MWKTSGWRRIPCTCEERNIIRAHARWRLRHNNAFGSKCVGGMLRHALSAYRARPPLSVIRPNNTFPVFATYLIPAASPPPLRGGAKSASNPFAGARKPGTWFSSLSGPAWAHADHADASSFWVCLAAPNAPMLPAAPPCALPPPSYLFSCAHRSPFSILFLSGLLAGCSPGVHPCSAT